MDTPKPTMKQAILAQCHQCLGHYQDGKIDCEVVKCPNYKWMPYRKLEPDVSWVEIHPRRRGLIKYEDIDTSGRNCDHLAEYRKSKGEEDPWG